MTLGDRIVIMRDGFIMQVGTPVEVFDRPGNLFVAEFIGAPKMNTFLAKLIKQGDSYFVECFGCKLPVTGDKARELKEKGLDNQTVILGVRPEHMTFSEEPAEGLIPAEIQVNEMMGSELHLHVLTPEVPEGYYGELTPEEAKNPAFAEDKGYLEGGRKKLIVRIPTVNLTEQQRAELVPGKVVYVGAEGKVMHFFSFEKGALKTNLLYGAGEEAEASQAN